MEGDPSVQFFGCEFLKLYEELLFQNTNLFCFFGRGGFTIIPHGIVLTLHDCAKTRLVRRNRTPAAAALFQFLSCSLQAFLLHTTTYHPSMSLVHSVFDWTSSCLVPSIILGIPFIVNLLLFITIHLLSIRLELWAWTNHYHSINHHRKHNTDTIRRRLLVSQNRADGKSQWATAILESSATTVFGHDGSNYDPPFLIIYLLQPHTCAITPHFRQFHRKYTSDPRDFFEFCAQIIEIPT